MILHFFFVETKPFFLSLHVVRCHKWPNPKFGLTSSRLTCFFQVQLNQLIRLNPFLKLAKKQANLKWPIKTEQQKKNIDRPHILLLENKIRSKKSKNYSLEALNFQIWPNFVFRFEYLIHKKIELTFLLHKIFILFNWDNIWNLIQSLDKMKFNSCII